MRQFVGVISDWFLLLTETAHVVASHDFSGDRPHFCLFLKYVILRVVQAVSGLALQYGLFTVTLLLLVHAISRPVCACQ